MSLWTDFRDSAVNTVVPEKLRNIDASQAGELFGAGLVKIAASAPAGNLNAADIEAGKTGAPSNGVNPGQSLRVLGFSLPVLVAIGAGIYFLMRKK